MSGTQGRIFRTGIVVFVMSAVLFYSYSTVDWTDTDDLRRIVAGIIVAMSWMATGGLYAAYIACGLLREKDQEIDRLRGLDG